MVALPQEVRALRGLPPGPAGEAPAVEVSGIGRKRAREAAWSLVRAGAGALMSLGTAAGLRPGLAAGTLLLPETVIDCRQHRLAADTAWHQAMVAELAAHAHRLSTAPLAEAPDLLRSAGDKAQLLRDTGAVAADMESAAVGAVAREAGLPFLVVRAVADPAHGTIPACIAHAMDDRGRVRTGTVLARALVAPAQWLPLVRLAWWFRAADRALTRSARFMVYPYV